MAPPPPRRTSQDTAASDPRRLLRQQESLREVIESISCQLELRPLLTRIVHHACELLDAHDGTIGLFDEERNVIRTEAAFRMPPGEIGAEMPPGVGLAGEVLLRRGPVLLERYDRLRSMTLPEYADHAVIGLPISWHGRLIGFFGVGARPPRRFDPRDVEILTLFARHAAIAIENARQYQRESQRTERLALIARIGRVIAAGLDLDSLLQNAVDVIHDLLGYPNIAIGLVEAPATETLRIRAVGGHYRKPIAGDPPLYVAGGIMGAAVGEGRPILVNDVESDPRYLPAPGVQGIRAVLAIPITLGNRVLGVLDVESGGRFTVEDSESLQIIADHLAVAITNARLFENAGRLAALEERQKLARDLHDSITQLVFSASLLSQSIAPAWRRDPVEGERLAERVVELTRASLVEMRGLLHELRPAESEAGEAAARGALSSIELLERDGLATTLRAGARSTTGHLALDLDLERYRPQSLKLEASLYRMFQEALHNVLKHARATSVKIELASEDHRVVLSVADDGGGFDPERLSNGGGPKPNLGLRHMRERAEALGGTLTVRSVPGRGTTILAVVPAAGAGT